MNPEDILREQGNLPHMSVAALAADGWERPVMHSRDLAIAKWGNLWYVIDMFSSADAGTGRHIRTPVPQRWLAVEQADTAIRDGHYR